MSPNTKEQHAQQTGSALEKKDKKNKKSQDFSIDKCTRFQSLFS